MEDCWSPRVGPAGGRYAEVAAVAGEEPFTASKPFAVTLTPARLLDDLA